MQCGFCAEMRRAASGFSAPAMSPIMLLQLSMRSARRTGLAVVLMARLGLARRDGDGWGSGAASAAVFTPSSPAVSAMVASSAPASTSNGAMWTRADRMLHTRFNRASVALV